LSKEIGLRIARWNFLKMEGQKMSGLIRGLIVTSALGLALLTVGASNSQAGPYRGYNRGYWGGGYRPYVGVGVGVGYPAYYGGGYGYGYGYPGYGYAAPAYYGGYYPGYYGAPGVSVGWGYGRGYYGGGYGHWGRYGGHWRR
jgi:hypothetical protein